MSAPTVLDAGALVTGLAWRVQPQDSHDEALPEEFAGDEQRSLARIAQLTRTHNTLCTQAVDAFEIAAGLEAAGVNDRQARAEYGAASVFELAQAMYDLVPTRPAKAAEPVDPWQRPVRVHLVHGLLYALPGLMYAVALSMLQTGLNLLLLLMATIIAAGLGQGLSLLGHVLIGRGQRDAASALFRTALVATASVGALVMLIDRAFGSTHPVAVLAGWQIAYLLAATILMVMESSVLLLIVLAPGVVLAIVELSGAVSIPRDVTLGIFALCVVAACVAAWFRLTGNALQAREQLRDRFGLARFDFAMSSGYFVYGIATAGLISFAVVDAVARGGNAGAGSIALMMLPLVASLGVAEWLVYRLRSRAITLLRGTSSVEGFRVVARAELARATLLYSTVLAGLTVATVMAFPQDRAEMFVLNTCAYGVLGLAFFCTTLLLSLQRHRLALGLAGGALLVDTSLRLALSSYSAGVTAAMHLLVFALFLMVVLPTVMSRYASAGAHR
ncbi:MAG: hypothetical protein NVV57_03660 [Demequina sp.]|nr:hypothetical protein [Demequina sp.]